MVLEIAPSIMAADTAKLGEECETLEAAGADRVHWDIMDGTFVPNLTFGPDVVKACRKYSNLHFEAHLMVADPDKCFLSYIEAGCDSIMIHVETCPHLHRSLTAIADAGASPGVALNPHTPAVAIAEVLSLVDTVLVMTVNPGFGGQNYIVSVEPKIAQIKRMINAADRKINLEVDGGIKLETAAGAVTAGANLLVAGTAIFKHPAGPANAIASLRESVEYE